MKLLFDQNLSYRLVESVSEDFPQSSHVRLEGLSSASDTQVWEFARRNDFIIVSKDSDFHQRSLTLGAPPKVIWIQRGNCSTDEILNILINHTDDIRRFAESEELTFLEIS